MAINRDCYGCPCIEQGGGVCCDCSESIDIHPVLNDPAYMEAIESRTYIEVIESRIMGSFH